MGMNLVDEDKKVAYHAHLMAFYKKHAEKSFRVPKKKGTK